MMKKLKRVRSRKTLKTKWPFLSNSREIRIKNRRAKMQDQLKKVGLKEARNPWETSYKTETARRELLNHHHHHLQ
jgi:hypothetical protein